MTSLKKLEEFDYSFFVDKESAGKKALVDSSKSWIYSWCAQNLPHLKKITTHLKNDIFNRTKIAPIFSGTSSLEALNSTNYLPEASLPNLKELTFHGDIKDTQFFTKIRNYSNLTTLELHNIRLDELDQVLESFGRQLTSLTFLSDNHIIFDYFKVVHLCPKLVKLHIMVWELKEKTDTSKFKELVSSENFRHLESVEFGAHEHEGTLPDGFLEFIFQAPLLKIIKLTGYILKNKDLKLIQRCVVESRFQKLERVAFGRQSGCTKDDLQLAIKLLVCAAIKLKEIRLPWLSWYVDSTPAAKFLELLKVRSE